MPPTTNSLIGADTPNSPALLTKITTWLKELDAPAANTPDPDARPTALNKISSVINLLLYTAKGGAFLGKEDILKFMKLSASITVEDVKECKALSDNPDMGEIYFRCSSPITQQLTTLVETASKLDTNSSFLKKTLDRFTNDTYTEEDLSNAAVWISTAKREAKSQKDSFSTEFGTIEAIKANTGNEDRDPYYLEMLYILAHQVTLDPYKDFKKVPLEIPESISDFKPAPRKRKSIQEPLELF